MTVARAPHLRRTGLAITIVSLLAIGFATLLPGPDSASGSHFCLLCGSFGVLNAVMNILLFVPLGIGVAVSGVPRRRALVAMCALSALIETAQFFVISGRNSTIGDVVTNALGGALGFAIGRYCALLLHPPPRAARSLAVGWAAIWLAVQATSVFGFSLSLPDLRYYGQLARTLGNFEVFPGRVINASVGEVQIPNTELVERSRVERLLLEGATVATAVIPAEPTVGIAPILRIADANGGEIVLLAQDGKHLIFGVHTGAAVLQIRPPLFGLPGAFPSGPSNASLSGDTVTLSCRFEGREITMISQSVAANHLHRISLTPSLGWTLWLPFQWFIEGTRAELMVGWIWLACLAIPLGYWLFRIEVSSPSPRNFGQRAFGLLAGAAVLCAGLGVLPRLFGQSPTPLRDWLATLAGVMIGWALRDQVTKLIVNQHSLAKFSGRLPRTW